MTNEQKINNALELAFNYGQIDGAHHLRWTIDQMVQVLTGEDYQAWVEHYEEPESDDPDDRYSWDTGIAP